MASKMADIQRQLERATGHAAVAAKVQHPAPATISTTTKGLSRDGKIHIGAYLHPDFKTSLRLVQARTGKDIQTLLARALNELFRAHNAPVIDKS
jgi:antitoxin-like ribbon-helix-helix protein